MARLLIAAELAARPAELQAVRALARAARSAGHEVLVALRDPGLGPRLLGGSGAGWVAAPVLPRPVARPIAAPLGFAGLLHNAGFSQGPRLLGRARAWRALLRLSGAQALIAFRSPTALLAARGLGIKVMQADTSGLFAPPATTPLPLLRPWAATEPARQAEVDAERALLERSNKALGALGAPALDHLGALFAADATALTTFWQLDPYGRRDLAYLGWRNPPAATAVAAPSWPTGEGARVFAALRRTDALDATLDALQASGQRVLALVVGGEAAAAADRDGVRVLTDAAEAAAAQRDCDLALVHGAPGQVATLLAAGRPLVLMPRDAEQRAVARRVVEFGAGRLVAGPAELGDALRALAADPAAAAAAKGFADRHGGHDDQAFASAFLAVLGKLVPAPAAAPKAPPAGAAPAPKGRTQ